MNLAWLKLSNTANSSLRSLWEKVCDFSGIFYVRAYLILLILLNIINWLAARAISGKATQNLVILHYNIDFGVNLIGGAARIYVIPALGLAIILINYILSVFIHKQSKTAVHLLLAAAILSNLFLLFASASLYLINFR